jgi:hypothetical protein
MEERVRATSKVGPDVVKVSAMSREVGLASPLVHCPVIGPPFLRQVLYLIMRTSSVYYTAYMIAIYQGGTLPVNVRGKGAMQCLLTEPYGAPRGQHKNDYLLWNIPSDQEQIRICYSDH